MHWWYKLIEKRDDVYIYAYSCESDILDGIITYHIANNTAEITKESVTDEGKPRRLKRSVEHFYTLVRENLPEIRHICCG